MRLACLLAVLALAACAEPGAPATPPEGWVDEGDRWYLPGTDTEAAFRDLESVEAMGVVREDESDFVRWFQRQMDGLYRTNPEVVDSVFGAEFLPGVREGAPTGDDYEEAARGLVRRVQTDFYQRYNPAQYALPETPAVIPDSLADESGRVAVQVYVNEAKEPVAVKVVEGTGTTLDRIAMRRAVDSEFTDAWVRETAGRSAGKNVVNWVRITSTFGEAEE
jgi:hypothetical protein